MAFIADELKGLIQSIGDLVRFSRTAAGYSKTTSLTEITKLARVEPLTVVSRDCLTLEYLPDVMQTLLSIFAGYYLQAIALSAKIDNVKVVRLLDRLNPDRDASAFMMESMKDLANLSMESYTYRLPTTRAALEEESIQELERKLPNPKGAVDGDTLKALVESSNLAVGKMINVDLQVGEQRLKIPVTIRLTPASIPNQSILHILAMKTEDNTFVERFHAWRSGRIAFWKDLMLAQDLLDQHQAALMKDEHGVYSEIIRRTNNAKKYGLLDQNPSLSSASNLFILSETTAREVELKLGGKLSNARIHQRAFENTYAMIITVIDRESERVTFYHRGVAMATEVSIRDIKASAKNKGPDIMDIFKSYQLGQNPQL